MMRNALVWSACCLLGLLLMCVAWERGRLLAQTKYDDQLLNLLLQEKNLLLEFGPDHPKVKEVRTQIEVLRSFIGESEDTTPPKRSAPGHADAVMKWEPVDCEDGKMSVSRAKVPGGWLVFVRDPWADTGGVTFYPDASHAWQPLQAETP